MSVLIESSRSVVGDHVCERSHGIIVHRPARLMGLRTKASESADPVVSATESGIDYTAVTTATTYS
jgi:hypothetical protein